MFLRVTEVMNGFQEECFATISETSQSFCDSEPIRSYWNVSGSEAFTNGFVPEKTYAVWNQYTLEYPKVQGAAFSFFDAARAEDIYITYSPCGIPKPTPWTYDACGGYINETIYDSYFYSNATISTYVWYGSYYSDFEYTDYACVVESSTGERICRAVGERTGNGTSATGSCDVPNDAPAETCRQYVTYTCDQNGSTCRSSYSYGYCYRLPVDTTLPEELRASNTTIVEVCSSSGAGETEPFDYSSLPFGVANGGSTSSQGTNVPVAQCDFSRSTYTYCTRSPQKRGPATSSATTASRRARGPVGFTIFPEIQATDPGGDLIVISGVVGSDIPLNDPTNLYQYGFVFDADGNTGNNYVPPPAFPNDFFKDSDRWYEVNYSPQAGWTLRVTDARNNQFNQVSSAAERSSTATASRSWSRSRSSRSASRTSASRPSATPATSG